MAGVIYLAVLFSGKGSNLEALIRRFHGKMIEGKRIEVVALTNRPDAGGIRRARKYGIEPIVLDHRRFDSREAFDAELVRILESYSPRLTVLAGFMRILTPVFTERIEAINLHPSLLPLFKGADALRRSFESGMKVGGITIHRVSQELDSGEILDQGCVKIEERDTLEGFEKKIHALEHRMLPEAVERLLKESALS